MSPSSREERVCEQDIAAGGRENRLVALSNGRTATASVSLQHFKKSRRVYAYVRYKSDRKTINLYVGDATAPTRKQALAIAWALVLSKRLLESGTRSGGWRRPTVRRPSGRSTADRESGRSI